MGFRARRLGMLFLIVSMALIGSLEAQPIGQPQGENGTRPENQRDNEGRSGETFWQRTLTDPVAFFTLWVAAFTSVLAGSSIWLAHVSRRDLRILQRAYIAVEPDEVRLLNSPNGGAIANITIRNVGNLPARDVRWEIRHAFSDRKRLRDLPIATGGAEGENAVPPRLGMTQGSPILSVEGEQLPSAQDRYLYVWGAVRYDDGFGKNRVTRFCHRFNCRNFTNAGIKARFARYHRYGNDAD